MIGSEANVFMSLISLQELHFFANLCFISDARINVHWIQACWIVIILVVWGKGTGMLDGSWREATGARFEVDLLMYCTLPLSLRCLPIGAAVQRGKSKQEVRKNVVFPSNPRGWTHFLCKPRQSPSSLPVPFEPFLPNQYNDYLLLFCRGCMLCTTAHVIWIYQSLSPILSYTVDAILLF